MNPNPYEPPREQGFETPEQAEERAQARDTIALFMTAIGICVVLAIVMLVQAGNNSRAKKMQSDLNSAAQQSYNKK
jgi:hypothetical protein